MHMLIGIIVHAKDEKQAFEKAENALKELVRGEKHFDYYSTFDDERTRNSYVDWSHLPPVMLASTPNGKHFIESCWEDTIKGFKEAFEQVKLAVQYLSLEDILERKYPEDLPEDIKKKINFLFIQVNLDELGYQPGHPKYLYHDYEPILCKSDLEFALKPGEGQKVYVVPADVHY